MPERSGRRRFPPQNPAAFRSFSFTQTTRLKTQRPPQPQRVRVHLLLVLPWGCEPPPAPHLCSPQPNLPPHAPNAAPPHRPPPQISTPGAAHPAPFRSGPALSPRGPASLGSPPTPITATPHPNAATVTAARPRAPCTAPPTVTEGKRPTGGQGPAPRAWRAPSASVEQKSPASPSARRAAPRMRHDPHPPRCTMGDAVLRR